MLNSELIESTRPQLHLINRGNDELEVIQPRPSFVKGDDGLALVGDQPKSHSRSVHQGDVHDSPLAIPELTNRREIEELGVPPTTGLDVDDCEADRDSSRECGHDKS